MYKSSITKETTSFHNNVRINDLESQSVQTISHKKINIKDLFILYTSALIPCCFKIHNIKLSLVTTIKPRQRNNDKNKTLPNTQGI